MHRLLIALLTALAFASSCGVTTPGSATDGGFLGADAGPPGLPFDAGPPIDAGVAETWTWVDFPDTTCGNGVATGLGVNVTSRSSDVVIFLEGGGACWEVNSCFVLRSAVNIESGYTGTTFGLDATRLGSLFDRGNTANPFTDASYVLVPYCTGDLHAGRTVRQYSALGVTKTVHHQGAANIDAYLRRLATTFAGPRRIFLMGTSAGAYGAQLNYHRFAAAFPEAEVHVLADSGPLIPPNGSRVNDFAQTWDLELPTSCTDCARHFEAVPGWLATTWPTRRFGLLSYDADATITLFFNYPYDGSFTNALNSLLTRAYARDNLRFYVLPGTTHTMLGNLTTLSGPGAGSLQTWVTRWKSGDAAWANAR